MLPDVQSECRDPPYPSGARSSRPPVFGFWQSDTARDHQHSSSQRPGYVRTKPSGVSSQERCVADGRCFVPIRLLASTLVSLGKRLQAVQGHIRPRDRQIRGFALRERQLAEVRIVGGRREPEIDVRAMLEPGSGLAVECPHAGR